MHLYLQDNLERSIVRLLNNQLRGIKRDAKCGPKTKKNVQYFSKLSSPKMFKIFHSCFLVAILIKPWTNFSKTSVSAMYCVY